MKIMKTDPMAPYRRIGEEARRRGGAAVRGFDWAAAYDAQCETVRLLALLRAELKSGQSPEAVPALLQEMRPHLLAVARQCTVAKEYLKAVMELARDPAFAAQIADLSGHVKMWANEIEESRRLAKDAKDAIDAAEAFLKQTRRDATLAEQEWSARVLELQGHCDRAGAESKALDKWYQQAMAAVDAAALARLRGAPPATPSLDTVREMPRGGPLAGFEREFDMVMLPLALRNEIAGDMQRLVPLFGKAQAMATAAAMRIAQVQQRTIEPPDARKGLKALGLEATLLPRLRAALEQPAALREKALDALARAFKLPQNGRQMLLVLQKAKVV